MSIFVTSDQHFDHKNIIKYSKRPFAELGEMNQAIISRWNKTVSPTDTVYVLGDFCFGKYPATYLNQLNGHLHLIKGNHDSKPTTRYEKWVDVSDYKEIKHEGVSFVLCHYPFETWRKSHHGAIHLHGHCHGNSREVVNRWDVGVDVFDFTPVKLEWFIERRKERGPYQHDVE